MVGHMSVLEQVDADFSGARRRALLRRMAARLRRDTASGGLPCFDDVKRASGAVGWIQRGTRTVPVGQISDSVGRCSEFDKAFMPLKMSSEDRWKRVDRAFWQSEELPAVSLYRVGDSYFVLDGHHRISVARYHGVQWIDAEVMEFRARVRGTESSTGPDRGIRRRKISMQEMMAPQLARQRREELLREGETRRLASVLRAARGRRAGRGSALAWEAKRHAGRLLKVLGALGNAS
jgi:hypothetical protein